MNKAKKWAGIYAEWKASSQSQKSYCEERGIKIWDLKAGIRAARDAGLISKTGRSATDGRSAFVPVIVTEERLSGVPYCEIRFNGHPGVRIETRESVSQVRELIQGLWH